MSLFGAVASHYVATANSYATEVLADSPLAFWKLDETSGTTMADSSGNARDGTYVNTPTLGATGLIGDGGTAVTFNGTDEYGEVGFGSWMPAGNTQSFTLEAFCKTTSSASQTLIARADSATPYRLGISGGRAFMQVATGGGAASTLFGTSTTLNNGSVHHIVGTWDGTTTRLYVDGVFDTSTAKNGVLNSTSSALRIGQRNADLFWAGTIDVVAFYATPLVGTRIAAHYAAR